MSCPDEIVLSVYVDDELPHAQRRPLEVHLVQCADCRSRVLALRDEAQLLGDVLLDREPQGARLPARPAPARGLALGAVPAVAAAALVTGVGGALLESRLPVGFDWLHPLRILGARQMIFDLVFTVRDAVPGLLELGLAVGGTLGFAALLTFAVTALFRRWLGPGVIGLAALALLGAPAPSQAHFGLHQHEDFDLPAGETHHGTLLLSGGTVNIDGVVDGDLITGAERVTVRGEVRGNLYAFAESIEIGGRVEGSLIAATDRIVLRGEVRADVYAFAERFSLEPNARIGRNLNLAVEGATLEGEVGRDVFFAGDWADVRSTVARDLNLWHAEVRLLDGARIGGDVNAALKRGTELDVAPGAVIAGETRTSFAEHLRRDHLDMYTSGRFYLFQALLVGAAFVAGMVLHTLLPGLFRGRLETGGAFFQALGVGFLAALATPVALLLVACTVIGIPLALMGLSLYVMALYVAGIAVAALVGRALLPGRDDSFSGFGLAFLVGLLVVTIVTHLPFVRVVVHVVVILTGLGMLVERARSAWRARGPQTA